MDESPVLAAALRYASAGVYVFPTRLYVRGEGKKGVSPIGDWDQVSSTDPDIIREWFAGVWRDAALCIDTGRSGIVGIDQDIGEGKDGLSAWAALEHESTWRVRSPTGGAHDYYRADPAHPFTVDNVGTVAEGVDVRSMGGFLFAPPSIDPRGGMWQWENGEPDWGALPLVPEVVIKRMEGAAARKRIKSPPVLASTVRTAPPVGSSQLFTGPAPESFGPGGGYKKASDAGRLLSARLDEFLSRTEQGSERSHFLAQDLGVLAGHGVGVFWNYEDALDTLMQACHENGFALANGQAYAQQQAERGLSYGMREPWVRVPEDAPVELDGSPPPWPTGTDKVDALISEMLTADEMQERPAPKYLIKGILNLDSEAWTIGAPGCKKSFVVLDQAIHIVRGQDWRGMKVTQGPVVMIVAEGAGGMSTRIKAYQQEYGRIGEGLFMLPRPVQVSNVHAWRVLAGACKKLGAVMIVIDTQARVTVGLKENDATDMGVYVDAVSIMRRETAACVHTIHHTGRDGGNARGSSAIDGAQGTELKVIRQDAYAGVLKVEKQKDMEVHADIPLHFKRVVVGLDEDGDEITSLVLIDSNAFKSAEGAEQNTMAPKIYIPTFDEKDKWRQRILDTLYAYAPTGVGWTKAEVAASLAAEEGTTGAKLKDGGAFKEAWRELLEARDPEGEPLIHAPSASKYEIGSPSLRAGLAGRLPSVNRDI